MTDVRLRPERFVAGGEALARDPDGRVVFVRGGVPGDEVAVDPVEQHADWRRVEVSEVLAASPDRVEPPCPRRRAGCGGCDWQHVAVPAQLPAKAEVVRDALRRTARLPDADVTVGVAVPSEGYRTTIRVVGADDGRASYRAERSHDTVPAAGCLVAHPRFLPILDAVRLTPGLEMTLRTSVATGEITAWYDPAVGDVVGLPAGVRTGPSARLVEEVAGHRFQVSAGSFFQRGPLAAEALVAAVRRAASELDGAANVLDAYAGVGLFAATVAPAAAHVVAVESSRSAVADCRANLARRSALVEQIEVGRWRPRPGEPFDVAIADPARPGLGKPGVGALVAAAAPVLVLVSCDPVSMARDAALLAARGYRHAGTEVLDLFPHTHHVECVTRFERQEHP